MVKLVEGYADKIIVPEGARDAFAWDDDLAGFGIRRYASGKCAYVVKYGIGAQQRRHTLGKVVRGNLKDMRLEASRILAKARLGMDAVAEARAIKAKARRGTLGDLVPMYLEARSPELRARSSRGDQAIPRPGVETAP